VPPQTVSTQRPTAIPAHAAPRPLAFARHLPGRAPLHAAAESTFRVTLDRDGRPRSRWLDSASGEDRPPPADLLHDPLLDLDRVLAAHANPNLAGPFRAGWIGWLSYDLGRWIEPAADGGGGGRRPATTAAPRSSNSIDSLTSRDRQGAVYSFPPTNRDRQGAVFSARSDPRRAAPPTSPPSSAPSNTSAPATPTR